MILHTLITSLIENDINVYFYSAAERKGKMKIICFYTDPMKETYYVSYIVQQHESLGLALEVVYRKAMQLLDKAVRENLKRKKNDRQTRKTNTTQ